MTNRSKFTPEEDQKLVYIVSTTPEIKWSKVAELMKNKTSRQCRERYKNYLAKGINQSPWTPEEDQVLLKAYQEIGPCWSHMTSLFQGRTCVNIKNHYAKIKNKIEKPEKSDIQVENNLNKPNNIIKKPNNLMIPPVVQPNVIASVSPYIFNPIIPQINQTPIIDNDQSNLVCNDHKVGPIIPNTLYDYKVLTRKQQVFQQLQLQHQQQLKQADLNDLQNDTNDKKGPLYVLPFFGETNKVESSPDNFVNLISLKVNNNDQKKFIEQDYENSHSINFYENENDVLLCQHHLLSEAPSLMLSSENTSTKNESPIYEPDSFVERDDFSAIYDFSHDCGDYNTCQDALFIPLG